MNPNHAATIKERYLSAISLNDVDATPKLKAIRKRAKELGYTEEQLQQVYKEARDESKHDKLDAYRPDEMAEQQPKPPESTPEPPKEEMQPMQRMQMQNLSERDRDRDYSKSGLTPSGTSSKRKYNGPSILDIADKRVEK